MIISLSLGLGFVLTMRKYFRPTHPIQPAIYMNPNPGNINSAAWLHRPSAIKCGSPSVPHNKAEREYLSNRACVRSICWVNAKAGGDPTSYWLARCSSFFTLAFNRFVKAGDSLHFVKPPLTTDC